MTCLILGANGQVGRAFSELLAGRALALTREGANLADPAFISQLDSRAGALAITAVLNAAAYTQVDKAEGEGEKEAFRVNAEAVGELGAWCARRDIPLLHFSTDYVFNGKGDEPWRETDATGPLGAYGESKLRGEEAIRQSGCRHLIFRTSWVYDSEGKNFFNTMLRLFKEKDELKVVSDQVGAPTYAPHLAASALAGLDKALAEAEFPSGIYHLCHGGETSWHGFASRILELARTKDSGIRCRSILPIPSSEYPTPARRPLNSRLDCAKAREVLGLIMPQWQDGLAACINEKYGHTGLQNSRP
jgi:dTDP-4-dehydrorhamnose reductase